MHELFLVWHRCASQCLFANSFVQRYICSMATNEHHFPPTSNLNINCISGLAIVKLNCLWLIHLKAITLRTRYSLVCECHQTIGHRRQETPSSWKLRNHNSVSFQSFFFFFCLKTCIKVVTWVIKQYSFLISSLLFCKDLNWLNRQSYIYIFHTLYWMSRKLVFLYIYLKSMLSISNIVYLLPLLFSPVANLGQLYAASHSHWTA